MLLVEVSWAARVWALPFLTGWCPSERVYQQRRRSRQPLIERAWQIIQLVQHWLPTRELIFVADSSVAALELLKPVSDLDSVSLMTRRRLDAALYDEVPVFVRRWTMAVTVEEVRAHLGVETQRQRNDLAIARVPPT
jgi:hypothetical protein